MSSDSKEFRVLQKAAEISETIRHLIEDTGVDQPITLPSVDEAALVKVIEYITYHSEHEEETEERTKWDQDFIPSDQTQLFNVILAANYLDIKPLLDLTCKRVADMIKGCTTEEIRAKFGIVNDFTPEEEEQIRKENEWCEER